MSEINNIMEGKQNKTQGTLAFIEVLVFMVVLQTILFFVKMFAQSFILDNRFYMKMITMGCMIILTFMVVLWSSIKKVKLSVFPEKFSKMYLLVTAIAAILFISTPSNFVEGITAILVLIYGSIVTPMYEELLFRGYIWNRLNPFLKVEKNTWLITAVLFSVWHLGYVIPNIWAGDWFAVITKMVVGFAYGILLGYVRLKTQNCYSTILLHGVLNIFM